MERVRVLMAGLPEILGDLLETMLAEEPDLHVVGRVPADAVDSAAVARADVLVWQDPGSERARRELLSKHPALSILTVGPEGRTGSLHALDVVERWSGELSHGTLLDALRAKRARRAAF